MDLLNAMGVHLMVRGVVTLLVLAVLGAGLASPATYADPPAAVQLAAAPMSALTAKKQAIGTLKVTVSGSGPYTVTGERFHRVREASKSFKVKPGLFTVKAPGATVKPGKLRVRKGKTTRVQVTFPTTVVPTPVAIMTTPTPMPTGTPTPTPTPSGFPSVSEVGWQPTGVALTSYTGPTTITTSGTVIDGADIRSNIVVRANNVTIKRSRIQGSSYYLVLQDSGYSGLTLDQVEVTSASGAMGDRAIASFGTGLTVNRSYVHSTQRGIAVGDGTVVTDSYIDDLYNSTENHATAIAAWGNVKNVTLRHNTLGCGTGYCSSAMSVYPEQGANDSWTIDGNLFNGGGYCVYLGYTPSAGEKPNTNMKVTNNSFGTKYNTDCGSYGPVASWSWSTGNTWTNNVWYAPGTTKNGQTLSPPS